MKGYKAFNKDLTCRGMQYENGKEFTCDGELDVCGNGLHFCEACSDIFNYYEFSPEKTRVCEVEALGEIKTDDDKSCTDRLFIVRELTWEEVLRAANSGNGNSGNRNSGNRNSGNRNSGDWNSGDWNSGDWNSGNRNSGNRNSGDWNSGNGNSGNRNSGNGNIGNRNSGDWNSGDWNSGDWNSGNGNSGNGNSGNRNSGNRNSGNRNSGDWNSGNGNSGDWNSTNNSSGVLCTEEHECLIFDKPSGMTLSEWRETDAARLMNRIEFNADCWIWDCDMTEAEKEAHPEAEILGGYLRRGTYKPDFVGWWENLTDRGKRVIFGIPNFDADKWQHITGLDVRDDYARLVADVPRNGVSDETPTD